MTGTERTRLSPIEVSTLIAHEAVSTLDTVQTELPECMKDFRTALEALHTIHNLGTDGETLLVWLDTEVQRRAVHNAWKKSALPDRYVLPGYQAGRGDADGTGLAAV